MDTRAMKPSTEQITGLPDISSERPLLPFIHIRHITARRIPAKVDAGRSIERYLNADGLGELYVYALERVERLCGRAITAELLSLLWASRRGLKQHELAAITGRRERMVALAVDAVAHHLLWRDETMSLSSSLRSAVEERYLASGDERRRAHRKIAAYFAQQPHGPRRLEEELWQLHAAGEWDALAEAIMQPACAHALYESTGRHDLLRYWSAIARRRDISAMYEAPLEAYRRNDRECLGAALLYQLLGEFHLDRGDDEKGEGLLRRSLAIRLAVLGDDDPATIELARALTAIHLADDPARTMRRYERAGLVGTKSAPAAARTDHAALLHA